MLITGGVLVVAVLVVGALQLLPRGGASGPALPGTRTAAGILVPLSGTPLSQADGRALGRVDAPVTLTVWSDFQCPACKQLWSGAEPRLIREYVTTGKLRLVYRDHTIIGPESRAAASAARCADQQGKFWPYHDVLFANQAAENSGALTPARLQDMADAVGLDRTTFDQCIQSSDVLNDVDVESKAGDARGRGTPTLDFGSVVIPGVPPYDELRATIDGLLAAAAAPSGGGSPAATAAPSPSGT